jgi:hypothetical protein
MLKYCGIQLQDATTHDYSPVHTKPFYISAGSTFLITSTFENSHHALNTVVFGK